METKNKLSKGHLHPITSLIREIERIFATIGFSIADGPEIETEFYNFDALNIPAHHPARDMQDTFWLKTRTPTVSASQNLKGQADNRERRVLRTHTSPVQIRYMELHKPPFRIIVPGKVFRNEATDATHEAQFYQLEGLMVDEKVSLADLKGTLEYFYKKLFVDEVKLRFRPSYFPFVEPALEVDIFFKDKWLEVNGAGLVHPKVFEAAGVDPKNWQGFAFGGGIDRLAMIKYGIPDVRHFYSGDLRLSTQF